MKRTNFVTVALLVAVSAPPVMSVAQESHEDAKAQVDAHEAKHHTKAKIVGGSAAGGAVAGAAVAGPAGAVVGAGAGAVGGVAIAHHHKKSEIEKKEETGTPGVPPS